MLNTQTNLILLILVIALDLVLTAAKTGLINARFTRLLALHDQTDHQTDQTIQLLNNRSQMRASLLVSQTVLRFLTAGLAILSFVPLSQPSIPILRFGIVLLGTSIILAFAEHVVEIYTLQEPEIWALRLTKFSRILFIVLTPLLAIPLLIDRLAISDPAKIYSVTEDELKILLDAGQEEGVLEHEERKMIYSIFQFGDTLAREIMVPRIDILALPIDTPIPEATDTMLQSGFSRVPVFEDAIDRIVGVLYVKDLLRLCQEGRQQEALSDHLRSAYFVPETKKVDELMAEMQNQRIHISVVVDEYGGVAGLVTLEDIVEELVGEIQDEYDHAEEKPYQIISDDEYLFQARIDLDDFNQIMNAELPREEADTLGGLIYSRIGRIPKGGETVHADDILLTVEQVTGRRIRKVRAKRISPITETTETKSNVD